MKTLAMAERDVRRAAIKASCDLLKMLADIDEAYHAEGSGGHARFKEQMRVLHDFLNMKRQLQPN